MESGPGKLFQRSGSHQWNFLFQQGLMILHKIFLDIKNLIIADENIKRKNYNVFELVMIHIAQLSISLDCTEDEAREYFIMVNNETKGLVQVEDKNVIEKTMKVLEDIGYYKSISTLINNMTVLNMPKCILTALNDSIISFKVAQLINKYSKTFSENEIADGLKIIIDNKWGFTKSEAYFKEEVQKKSPGTKPKQTTLHKQVKGTFKSITSKIDSLSKKKQGDILAKLREIEDMM